MTRRMSRLTGTVARGRDARPDPHVNRTVLSFSNMHEKGDLFINYLRARKEVFIDHKGWHLPEENGMEFDQYDTPKARWIVLHEYGEILAGVRIAPTTAQCGAHSYMIRDAQLGLLDGLPYDVLFFDAPQDDKIWEATRLFVVPSVPADRRMRINALLLHAMADGARAEGADHVIGIVPAVFRRWMSRLGMSATPVGPPMIIDGDKVQAALMKTTYEMPVEDLRVA
ncbi:acyl-homoserine-lactone synthase [Acidimangrovimonas sediminis]|uniref:acyl-homoserine-lactone synthase n=1 Tax=Acidimangrovimonas sediminis TaxID=2056283 RepID=UPI001E65CB97|nr:acyl-homoserine-lactone synthase [Acidimangrovimonas sediminis]